MGSGRQAGADSGHKRSERAKLMLKRRTGESETRRPTCSHLWPPSLRCQRMAPLERIFVRGARRRDSRVSSTPVAAAGDRVLRSLDADADLETTLRVQFLEAVKFLMANKLMSQAACLVEAVCLAWKLPARPTPRKDQSAPRPRPEVAWLYWPLLVVVINFNIESIRQAGFVRFVQAVRFKVLR